jgi:hypothetical protein
MDTMWSKIRHDEIVSPTFIYRIAVTIFGYENPNPVGLDMGKSLKKNRN